MQPVFSFGWVIEQVSYGNMLAAQQTGKAAVGYLP
jgi:hypothetical protein